MSLNIEQNPWILARFDKTRYSRKCILAKFLNPKDKVKYLTKSGREWKTKSIYKEKVQAGSWHLKLEDPLISYWQKRKQFQNRIPEDVTHLSNIYFFNSGHKTSTHSIWGKCLSNLAIIESKQRI